ncbi:hypothetical protein M378DRAFT_169881 [Amanita muscaria Koide BX008]|uniref:Uncharacterized protein n=1 Tax=Amanita muscaria (strain Koide BX008) TaxID=946122 RepID=A0A0C2WRU2_AMAMK|nr:hypothetical protein M378DRAFT_169881 [Amanita muscaria Koide BX008]
MDDIAFSTSIEALSLPVLEELWLEGQAVRWPATAFRLFAHRPPPQWIPSHRLEFHRSCRYLTRIDAFVDEHISMLSFYHKRSYL